MEKLLPRHMQIVYDINWRFLQAVRAKFGDDWERISRMSIIEEGAGGEKCAAQAEAAAGAGVLWGGAAARGCGRARRSLRGAGAALAPRPGPARPPSPAEPH